MLVIGLMDNTLSEKYRRYVVELRYQQQRWYILWGPDLTTRREPDGLLVNRQGQILIFKEIAIVIRYIRQGNFLPYDAINFKRWAQHYEGAGAYSGSDLDRIDALATSPIQLDQLTKEEAIEIINFINLFGDYAYQRETQDTSLLVLHREHEVRTFFDYVYDNYVWDLPEHIGYHNLNELDYLRFNEEKFREQVRQMLESFMKNTIVWNG